MALSVSSETVELVREFTARRRSWGFLPESSSHLVACLDSILKRGEPDAAVLLWPGIDNRPAAVQQRTLEVMSSLLARASASRAIELIGEVQRGVPFWSPESSQHWWKITPGEVRALAAFRPACAGLLVLLSGHHSGYVREAAVLNLDGLTQPFVIPALRDRLNDWVDPVRRAALRVMRTFLSADHAAALIDSLDSLQNLKRCGRADHQPLLDQVDMVLREPAARPHLKRGLSSPNPAIRRGCYATVVLAEESVAEWLTWGLDAKDPWIRLHAARTIRALPAGRTPDSFLDRMVGCGLRPVRQIAVEMIAERGYSDAVDRLKSFLLDPSPTLREFARFYLTKILGHFDAATFYRDGLAAASGSKMGRFIEGIGETGDHGDVERIAPHAKHDRGSVRLITIRALTRLAPETLTEPFLTALADPSGRVRQAAMAALAARRSEVPVEVLCSWASTADQAGRRSIVLLLGDYRIASQMPALLPFLADADDDIRGLAENLCLRGLAKILNPFAHPDPWLAWAEEHSPAWSPGHQERVRELIRRIGRGR